MLKDHREPIDAKGLLKRCCKKRLYSYSELLAVLVIRKLEDIAPSLDGMSLYISPLPTPHERDSEGACINAERKNSHSKKCKETICRKSRDALRAGRPRRLRNDHTLHL